MQILILILVDLKLQLRKCTGALIYLNISGVPNDSFFNKYRIGKNISATDLCGRCQTSYQSTIYMASDKS